MRVEDLASVTGLAMKTITRIESGYDGRVSTLRKLALGLGVPLVDLLESEEKAS